MSAMSTYLLHSEVYDFDGDVLVAAKFQFCFESASVFWDTETQGYGTS